MNFNKIKRRSPRTVHAAKLWATAAGATEFVWKRADGADLRFSRVSGRWVLDGIVSAADKRYCRQRLVASPRPRPLSPLDYSFTEAARLNEQRGLRRGINY